MAPTGPGAEAGCPLEGEEKQVPPEALPPCQEERLERGPTTRTGGRSHPGAAPKLL